MSELHYIAIEGVIGAGKTALAELLAERMNALTVLENPDENPFLKEFYRDPERFAFQTQIFFLLSRFKQQEEFPPPDLFHERVISDYIFAKDRIFATLNLSEAELNLYEKILQLLELKAPTPDLVVYLQSSPARLMKNIRIRGREYEKDLSLDYISQLNEMYNSFFMNYSATPLLVVKADNIDFVNNEEHLKDLIREIEKPFQGTRFYNPIV